MSAPATTFELLNKPRHRQTGSHKLSGVTNVCDPNDDSHRRLSAIDTSQLPDKCARVTEVQSKRYDNKHYGANKQARNVSDQSR